MKGLVLCGGKGTRLRPHSYTRPKHLLPVANRPVVEYALSQMVAVGIRDIGVVIPPHFKTVFKQTLGDIYEGARMTYIEQVEAKGLAHAVAVAESFVGEEDFLLYLGDNFLTGSLLPLIEKFYAEQASVLLLMKSVPNPAQFGVVEMEGNRVVKVEEKPKKSKSTLAMIGVYLFSAAIFDSISKLKPSARGEYEITDAIQLMIQQKRMVTAVATDEWWKDTGQSRDLLACNEKALEQLIGQVRETDVCTKDTRLIGNVYIAHGAQVINSIIEGPAVIGKGAVLIDAYIGPNTSIGDGVEVINSHIDHSIVLNHARIERVGRPISHSIIGAKAVVTSGSSQHASVMVNIGDDSQLLFPR